jgi:hypothetical protein
MRIIETLAKQGPKTALRTALRTMEGREANKAMVRRKEQVGIRTSQTGKSVKGHAVYSDENGSGEMRLWEEFHPMRIVIIRHGSLK